ncbi:amino acid adenylation domain-containing protein [Streptomyces sp. NA04227]|uniref:non-ribosomal peptide synthetase n=1 Tax=Streptomyces sp. NA04227 TaxID=2742136 RepID=UPI001591E4D5|nr:non-ribosomal peptide synthetase [Streptomyces sp. NA04227]QKW09297.1 amino acid adenylation domain-containing protein [Streptomyces sp. NA04227]
MPHRNPGIRLPLTAAQSGVWAAQQLDPGNPRYNCASYLEIHGPVDAALLGRAVRTALTEAEALRVRLDDFAVRTGSEDPEGAAEFDGPGQTVVPVAENPLELLDLSAADRPRATAEQWMRADLSRPVELVSGQLVRHVLIEESANTRLLYLRYHHLLMDGLGQTAHVRRIAEVYTALAAGAEPPAARALPLAELVAQDAAYAVSPAHRRDRAHWLERYADRPDPVSLGDQDDLSAEAGLLRRSTELSMADVELLGDAARRLGARPSALLVAAVAAYQCRITGAEETLLRIPLPARSSGGAIATPGMSANELPLRIAAPRGASFAQLVEGVSAELGRALRHQRFRGEELHRELFPEGRRGQLAGTTVNVVTFDADVAFGDLPSTAHHLSSGPVDDLRFDFFADARVTRVRLNTEANPRRHSPGAPAAHSRRLLTLLRGALAAPELPLGRLPLMDAAERRAVLAAGSPAVRDYDLDSRLHELIAAQAARTPDAVAAQVAGASLTYRELRDSARRLAAHLGDLGVAPGSIVGVHQERSLDLVVSLLAVLMAGGAYLPLDPELPAARLEFQIEDAGVGTVLSTSGPAERLAERLTGDGTKVVAVDRLLPELPATDAPLSLGTPSDTAYVIYTSGSTGTPKGVAVPHRGVVNRLLWMQEEYGLGADECVLQKTPFTFDVSVWEFFWPLLAGARLHLAEPGEHRDPRALATKIREHRVTTVHFVPPMLDLFLAEPAAAELPGLRRVVCSGEALRPETVARFLSRYGSGAHAPALFNLYGPTEASIDVTHWRCTGRDTGGPVPIGRAVANTGLYVLDPGGEPLPFGVPGELHIGGVQVASGYLNRPEQTAERFVPDPFGPAEGEGAQGPHRKGEGRGGTLYRTGDLAVLREDGVVEYRGRIDHQVKVRGFRIEPGEIESALLALPGVTSAVVTSPQQADGQRQLLAHVVAADATAESLTAALGERLPEYMVPSRIVLLDALPLLPNGKVDRRALPVPVAHEDTAAPGTSEDTAPADEAERRVHDAFAAALGKDRVALGTSFFALGGDSLLSIRVRSALERAGFTFALPDLYEAPTVRGLARRIRPYVAEGPRTEPFSLLSAADRELLPDGLVDAHPLSSMQTGMVFHAEYEEGSSVYRVVTGIRVGLPFDEDLLRGALDATVRRHPALRSSFHLTGFGEPLQLVHREVRVPLAVDERLLGADEAAREAFLAEWAEFAKHHDFTLTAAPLLAFTAHPLAEGAFQLGVVEHHVVLDGWSDAAMLDEIVRRYRAALSGEDLWLPEIPSTFREFVAAERQAAEREEHRAFWAGELAGAEPAPLPLRTAGRAAGAAHRRFDVPVSEETGARITAAARAAGLPTKSLLAAAHAVVLDAVTPGAEVLTGVVTHGRLEEDGGDQVIGVFLNTLPLRIGVRGGSWLELARRVHAHEQRTLPHRRYPYARVLRDHTDLSPDSYVNFMDFHQQWGSDAAIQDGFGIAETNFPLAANFLVDPAGGRLGLWLDCDTASLDPEFCDRLAGYYARALAALAADPQAAPPTELRGADERARLDTWNATATDFGTTATLPGLIARQIAATPDALALVDGQVRLSYAELDERAARLARLLRERGAGRGRRVGVSVRRGADLVVTLLAVARAGAAYVPMDPDFPADRLRYIAEDAALDCLVTGPGGPEELPAGGYVRLDRDAAEIAARSTDPLDEQARPGDPVYVIYTSGSTGRPKGTVLLHRNVVNFTAAMDERIGLAADDVVLALTSVSFDISVLELLWPLTRGASVVVAGERMIERLTPADGEDGLCALLARHGATLLQATPSFLAAVAAQPEALDALRGLRALLVGGEAFPSGLAQKLLGALPSVRVFNMYGPTETTIWSTVHELDRERDVHAAALPIGRPVANTLVRVTADDGRETPVGVAGELWIGGEGVAEGYLDRPELTAERFTDVPGGRFYRTGDRVRWRADGTLEFLGRIDRQVKILGHRIEPDEVESVLSRHPEVASVAVVAARRTGGAAELLAYVAPVAENGEEGAAGGERGHVDRWRDVWEGAYTPAVATQTAQLGDDERDFAGWASSYTKRPIPAHEMREWLGNTVERIRATGARRIVDVGVGVGLYLRELAPAADSYLGIDLSPAALATAASIAIDGKLPDHLTLRQGDALTLTELPDSSADLVLFNSVVQYFPGADYLRRALTEALRVAGPQGAVFVGDVRDLSLLPAFHADTQIRRAPALAPAREVAAAASRALAEERELCLTAAFFEEFAASAGAGLRVELKRGHHANELTRFRWDVTLLGRDRAPHAVADGKRVTWDELKGTGTLAELLAGTAPELTLTVTGLPDARLERPLAALELLHGQHSAEATGWDLERAVWEAQGDGALDPEDIAALGERHGRPVRLIPPEPGRVGEFDAVFEPVGAPPAGPGTTDSDAAGSGQAAFDQAAFDQAAFDQAAFDQAATAPREQ